MTDHKSRIGGKAIYLLLVIILPLLFTYLTKDKVDLKYYLSEPVSSFDSSKTVSGIIQELNVLNNGSKSAEKILVKIPYIKDCKVVPFSGSDDFKMAINDKGLELKYPTLPPAGNFKIILSTYSKIPEDSVKIYHSEGIGKNLLSNNIFSSTFLNIVFIYIVAGIISFITTTNSFICGRARYNPSYILRRNKPFFMGLKRWKETREEAIKKIISNDRVYTVDDLLDSFSYKILNKSTDITFSKDEQEEMLKNVIDTFELKTYELLYRFSIEETTLERLGKLEKPLLFPDGKWNELKKIINIRYREFIFYFFEYDSFISTSKKVGTDKPEYISEKIWSEINNILKTLEFIYNFNKISNSKNPIEDIKSSDFKYLDSDQREKLFKIAYQQQVYDFFSYENLYEKQSAEKNIKQSPEWLTDKDRLNFNEVANKTISYALDESILKWGLEQLEAIINDKKISEKPDFIDDITYCKYKDFEQYIVIKKQENIDQEKKLQEIKIELLEKNDISSNKLSKINEFIRGTIYTFEDVKVYFSTEEFNILRQLNK